MKTKTSKKFLILFISLPFLAVAGVIFACTDEIQDFYNSFFAPETSGIVTESSLFRSNNTFYGPMRFDDAVHTFDSLNIEEWHHFFGKTIAAEDLNFLVYHARIGEIDSLIFYSKDPKFPAKDYQKGNSVTKIVDKPLAKEFLFYLGFAKRCEPFVTYSPSWWDDNTRARDPRKDIASLKKLIAGGERALGVIKSKFIRERYQFQLTRLLYNSGDYERCISEFPAQKEILKESNSVKYRNMGYLAAAYYRLHKYSEANYLYSLLYDQCPEMKTIAYLSFHPQEEADWNEALLLAATNHQKEVLWQLMGIHVDPYRAMKAIYMLNPKSPMLNLLLVRSVNIQEEGFIPGLSYVSEKKDTGYAFRTNYLDKDLTSFIQNVANQNNSNKPYLWDLTAGYLSIVSKDYKLADAYLNKMSLKLKDNKLVTEQVLLFRVISAIEQLKAGTVKSEAELASALNWLTFEKHDPNLRQSTTVNWAQKRLAEKYALAGNVVLAQCLDFSRNPRFYDDPKNAKALVALMDKKEKTALELYALKIHPYSRKDIFEYEAITLLYQYKFREALAKFDMEKGSGDSELPGDPFLIHINDCHNCDHEAPQTLKYTKYSFIKHLAELSETTSGNPKKASNIYFLLANGLYNMTYFGNSRAVYESHIKSVPLYDFYYDESRKDGIYDCTKAESYYKKAMELAPNKELKAKYCFMASKCEQNRYYCSSAYKTNRIYHPENYFNQLKKDFSKTMYYKEIIEECGYFRTFVKE